MNILKFDFTARMLALMLKIPEETFVNMHKFEDEGESSGTNCLILWSFKSNHIIYSAIHEVVSLNHFLEVLAVSPAVTAIRAPMTTSRSRRMSGSRDTQVSGV